MPRYNPDPKTEFTTRIKILTDHGITLPEPFDALQRRLADFENLATPLRDRLVDAVVNGTPTKNVGIASLYAQAVAEALDARESAPVRRAVADTAHQKLVQIYSETAATNYQVIAREWDSIAATFTQQASIVDLELPALEAVALPEPQRQAWLAGEQTAHQLDQLLPVLTAAAQLAGLPIDNDPQRIGLCCHIPPEAHRRRAWEAWQSSGRCGRWSALLALDGVAVKAAAVDGFTPYNEPEPLELRQQQIAEGVHRNYKVDPHDPGYEPAPKPERVMIGGQMTTL